VAIEQARVVSVGDGFAELETLEKSACGSCKAKSVCGNGVIARYSANRCLLKASVSEPLRSQLEPGDWVNLSYPDRDLAIVSILVYIVPAILVVLAAIVGEYLQLPVLVLLLLVLSTMLGCVYLARYTQSSFNLSQRPIIDSLVDIRFTEV